MEKFFILALDFCSIILVYSNSKFNSITRVSTKEDTESHIHEFWQNLLFMKSSTMRLAACFSKFHHHKNFVQSMLYSRVEVTL